jgi:hypothetical protein
MEPPLSGCCGGGASPAGAGAASDMASESDGSRPVFCGNGRKK